jgi:hypothetical protein
MTDTSPAALARAQQDPDQGRVSRARRAAFAFGATYSAMAAICGFVWFKAPVNMVTDTSIHVLGDIGLMIGLAYIGGSVVDYSGMFRALGARFGVNIPASVVTTTTTATVTGDAAAATDDGSDTKAPS